MSLRIAILGDSAMWGQGLKLEHQYARVAAERIANSPGDPLDVLPGLGEEPGRGHPRSGAKIVPAVDKAGESVKVLLPSGGQTEVPPGDRATFALTFRSLFSGHSDQEMRDFLAGGNDRPAARLFGENPATFPTVTGQLRAVREDEKTDDVQFVFLNGGINDVDFEKVLDPTGSDIDVITQAVDSVFGDSLAQLLTLARQVFPNAVILVPGYFTALSSKSNRNDLKDLFEFLSKKPEWELALNNTISKLPLLGDITDALGLTKDVGALVEAAVHRTVTAAAHAHHRTKATIASLPAAVIGRGIVYAHPAFLPEHALFAGRESLLHSGYRFPGHGRLSVADEMFETRRRRIPRGKLLGDYHRISQEVVRALLPGEDARVVRESLKALVAANPDLPGQVLFVARDFSGDRESLGAVFKAIAGEVGRIEVATIASFLHPNPAGAKRYADRIVTAHQRHVSFRVRQALGNTVPAGQVLSVRKALSQHGIHPPRLRKLVPIFFIESVALQFIGVPVFPFTLEGGMTVTLGPRVQLTGFVSIGSSPGHTEMTCAFDTGNEVRLTDVTELAIKNGPGFEEIVLYLNGREFLRRHRNQASVAGGTVRFALDA